MNALIYSMSGLVMTRSHAHDSNESEVLNYMQVHANTTGVAENNMNYAF